MKSDLHIWHPFTQEALDPPPLRIARAQGAYLYTDDGRRLNDGIASCNPPFKCCLPSRNQELHLLRLASAGDHADFSTRTTDGV